MGRPVSDDLLKSWKIVLPATLAGRIEYMLIDPVLGKPLYGARGKLITASLEWFIARESGQPLPPIPTLEELRRMESK